MMLRPIPFHVQPLPCGNLRRLMDARPRCFTYFLPSQARPNLFGAD